MAHSLCTGLDDYTYDPQACDVCSSWITTLVHSPTVDTSSLLFLRLKDQWRRTRKWGNKRGESLTWKDPQLAKCLGIKLQTPPTESRNSVSTSAIFESFSPEGGYNTSQIFEEALSTGSFSWLFIRSFLSPSSFYTRMFYFPGSPRDHPGRRTVVALFSFISGAGAFPVLHDIVPPVEPTAEGQAWPHILNTRG